MQQSNNRFARVDLQAGRRMLVVSDIHGHLGLFDRLLERAGFGADDFLIILGDMVEDGESSLGSLRRCMALDQQDNVFVLSGNWEKRMAELLKSPDPDTQNMIRRYSLRQIPYCGSSLLTDMCHEMGEELTEDTDMADLMPRICHHFRRELDYMENLPVTLEAGGYFFVHGGVPTLDCDALARMPEIDLLKNDAFAEQGHVFDRWVVSGHWPVSLYDERQPRLTPHVFPESHIIAIDGGCGKKKEEQLNMLILRAGSGLPGEWIFAEDHPRIRALERQDEDAGYTNLRWTCDKEVDILNRHDDMVTVRSRKTGRVLDAPENLVFEWHGQTVCADLTDYCLAVEPGDELRLVIRCSKGLYAKKNGVVGWYTGAWEPINE